ncbi:secreted frizzled-related protein 5 [Lates japonicus]|uniref:Secreted frizzled-related protein 1 n=1 Tax=Lates japonicus TaxID=270547 RepID=A0AAD3REV3_LATJO|nr:secreted frizzled-related protein 5 [Lates japonicus]
MWLGTLGLSLSPSSSSSTVSAQMVPGYYSWQSRPNFLMVASPKQPSVWTYPADLRLCAWAPPRDEAAASWIKETHARVSNRRVPGQTYLSYHFAVARLRDSVLSVWWDLGFPWPGILACDKFIGRPLHPVQFIEPSAQPPVSKVCPPCDNELKADNIMEHYCASDFALKMKIKEVKKEKGDRKLIAAQKKKKVLKQGVLRKKDLKKLTLYIKNGANCPCSQLDSLSSNFLIMGRKVDQQLLLMSIHKWDKKSKELKFAIKYMKSHQCPTYHTVFQ